MRRSQTPTKSALVSTSSTKNLSALTNTDQNHLLSPTSLPSRFVSNQAPLNRFQLIRPFSAPSVPGMGAIHPIRQHWRAPKKHFLCASIPLSSPPKFLLSKIAFILPPASHLLTLRLRAQRTTPSGALIKAFLVHLSRLIVNPTFSPSRLLKNLQWMPVLHPASHRITTQIRTRPCTPLESARPCRKKIPGPKSGDAKSDQHVKRYLTPDVSLRIVSMSAPRSFPSVPLFRYGLADSN